VLLAEGREEANWNKAREAYNDVQRSIVRGEQLEFYDDVERLLPDHIKPQCLEMVMEIEEYDRSTTEKSRENVIQEPSKKRKRNNDPTRDIPPGACTGFVSVADLLVKQKKVKRRKNTANFDETAGLDDDTDEEIEAGLFAPRRAASTSATSAKLPKTKFKRAKTMAEGNKKRHSTSNGAKARKAAGNHESTLSQMGVEDPDDMEIERGLWNNSLPSPHPDPMRSSPDIPLAQNRSVIDICTSAAPSRSPSPSNNNRYPTPSRTSGEDPTSEHTSPSPPNAPVGPSEVVAPDPDQDIIAPNTKERETSIEDDSLAWLLADSDDAEAFLASSPVAARRRRSGSQASDAIEVEDSELEYGSPIALTSSPVRSSGPQALLNRDMPPPAVPPPRLRLGVDVAPLPLAAPSPSFPVRSGRYRAKKNLVKIADSSSPLQPPPPSQKRLHRRHSTHHDDSDPNSDSDSDSDPPRPPSPPKKRKRAGSGGLPSGKRRIKVRDTAAAARLIPWIDVEAGHSGDEASGGASSPSEEEGEESESDRRFAGDFAATQPESSYDQSAVYRRSLLSQAPAGARAGRRGRGKDGTPSVPVFAAPPVRRGATLGRIATAVAAAPGHERIARSSSPAPPDEEDYYMLGSFVVDDDAEISFMQSSDP
jgi:ATP-dependent DNA helicase MPH1